MFRMRKEIVDALAADRAGRLESEVELDLRAQFPEKCAALGDAQLAATARSAVERAAVHGVIATTDICALAHLMMALGGDFDRDARKYPWAAAILSSRTYREPRTRIAELFDRARFEAGAAGAAAASASPLPAELVSNMVRAELEMLLVMRAAVDQFLKSPVEAHKATVEKWQNAIFPALEGSRRHLRTALESHVRGEDLLLLHYAEDRTALNLAMEGMPDPFAWASKENAAAMRAGIEQFKAAAESLLAAAPAQPANA